jgi:uncharacterized membrane protein
MNRRYKSLFGSLILLAFTFFYFLVVTGIAMIRLPELALPWHLLYYFISTVVWVIVCGGIIYWMKR